MGTTHEHALNAALADLHAGAEYDDCLAIVDRFYAEHVQVSSDATPRRLIGKARVKQALATLLAPLFGTGDVPGRAVSLRFMPIYADRQDEHHSAWSLDIVDPTGHSRVQWSVRRIWRRGLVVHEHFFESDTDEHDAAVLRPALVARSA
jgi:hypothetical protein